MGEATDSGPDPSTLLEGLGQAQGPGDLEDMSEATPLDRNDSENTGGLISRPHPWDQSPSCVQEDRYDNHHKLDGLKQQTPILSQLGRPGA